MTQEPENIFVEEKITILAPLKSKHIFDEERFEVISTYTKGGEKLVILREKRIKE